MAPSSRRQTGEVTIPTAYCTEEAYRFGLKVHLEPTCPHTGGRELFCVGKVIVPLRKACGYCVSQLINRRSPAKNVKRPERVRKTAADLGGFRPIGKVD